MGDIQFVNDMPIGLIDCFPVRLSNLLPDPVISFGDGVDDTVSFNVTFVNFVGGATFANSINANNFIELNSTGGNLVFNASNIAGTYRVTGIADNAVTDNTNGATLLIDTLAASAVTLDATLQKIDYAGGIYIDTVGGEAGQEWPVGTASHPSNNIADAHAIAQANSIRAFVLLSNLTITIDMPHGHTITGATGGEVITFTGTDTSYLRIENAFVTGDMAGYRSRISNGRVFNLVGFSGAMYNTGIFGDLQIAPGSLNAALFVDSYTSGTLLGNETYGISDSGIKVSIGALGDGEAYVVDFRGFHGTIAFENIDNADKVVSAHMGSGFVIVAPSCSDGELWLQGTNSAAVVDISTGTTINFDELKVTINDNSKQTIRDAMALDTAEIPALGSIDHTVDRIDDNTQE